MVSSTSYHIARYSFPDLTKYVTENAESIGYKIVTFINEEPVYHLYNYPIRNPSLLPIQLAGILIGIKGIIAVSRHQSPGWWYAMLFFAFMNLSSIFCHNLLAEGRLQRFFVMLDIVFTGSACTSAILSQFTIPQFMPFSVFVILLRTNYMYSFREKIILYLPEMTYIGLLLLACLLLNYPLLTGKFGKGSGILKASTGQFIMVAAPALDDYICDYFNSQISAIHLIFVGSNLIMQGLIELYVSKLKSDRIQKKKFQ
jgi:hypothetical protein